MKVLDEEENEAFLQECKIAEQDISNREANLEAVYDKFERNMTIIGSTAVEDKLQDDVPQTNSALQKAGIKIWMLTGDKLETAENIAESCKLIKQGMDVVRLACLADVKKFCTQDKLYKNNSRILQGKTQCIVVEASGLVILFGDPFYKMCFLKISKTCEAVICCRVSPG